MVSSDVLLVSTPDDCITCTRTSTRGQTSMFLVHYKLHLSTDLFKIPSSLWRSHRQYCARLPHGQDPSNWSVQSRSAKSRQGNRNIYMHSRPSTENLPFVQIKVSFSLAEYTADVDAIGTLRLLDAIRTCGLTKHCRYVFVSFQILFR